MIIFSPIHSVIPAVCSCVESTQGLNTQALGKSCTPPLRLCFNKSFAPSNSSDAFFPCRN